jgi:hypothetical protein
MISVRLFLWSVRRRRQYHFPGLVRLAWLHFRMRLWGHTNHASDDLITASSRFFLTEFFIRGFCHPLMLAFHFEGKTPLLLADSIDRDANSALTRVVEVQVQQVLNIVERGGLIPIQFLDCVDQLKSLRRRTRS